MEIANSLATVRGYRETDGTRMWAVFEAAISIRDIHVELARQRADILAVVYDEPALAVIIGESIQPSGLFARCRPWCDHSYRPSTEVVLDLIDHIVQWPLRISHAYPVSRELSLRSQRGNLVGVRESLGRRLWQENEIATAQAPRNDNSLSLNSYRYVSVLPVL